MLIKKLQYHNNNTNDNNNNNNNNDNNNSNNNDNNSNNNDNDNYNNSNMRMFFCCRKCWHYAAGNDCYFAADLTFCCRIVIFLVCHLKHFIFRYDPSQKIDHV